MKIAIAGSGALGSRVGVHLYEAGFDVTLINKWEDHIHSINKDGLEVQTEDKIYHVPVKTKLMDDVNEAYDLIIVLTKAMHAEKMLTSLADKGAIHAETSVLTMMNGLGLEDVLSKFVSDEYLFLSVTMWTANLRGPGKIIMRGTGSIDMQRADGVESDKIHKINDVFNQAKLNSNISDTVQHSIWLKASLNSIFNPLCSILDKKIGEFVSYPRVIEMITPLVQEIVEVADARGVALDANVILGMIAAAPPEGEHYPSMHQDLSRGVQTEINYLNGKIAEFGKELGIKTPVNAMITDLIHQLEMKS